MGLPAETGGTPGKRAADPGTTEELLVEGQAPADSYLKTAGVVGEYPVEVAELVGGHTEDPIG